MALELDHAFVGCAPGAPEARALLERGLIEGTGNTHPGQGTANRRFFFDNFMLELLWVADARQVHSATTSPTRLAERCSRTHPATSPFGLVFRRAAEPGHELAERRPFTTWTYRPAYLPAGMTIEIALGVPLQEPELIVLPFLPGAAHASREPRSHGVAIGQIEKVSIGTPGHIPLSAAGRAAVRHGLVSYHQSTEPVMVLYCAPPFLGVLDLRPTLPLVFRGDKSSEPTDH